MDKLSILFFCFIACSAVVLAAPPKSFDLKRVFRTPRRNFDNFEILERNNFDVSQSGESESGEKTAKSRRNVNKSNNFANAQVMVRFGTSENGKKPCACASKCSQQQQEPICCRPMMPQQSNYFYYPNYFYNPYPRYFPQPYCYCPSCRRDKVEIGQDLEATPAETTTETTEMSTETTTNDITTTDETTETITTTTEGVAQATTTERTNESELALDEAVKMENGKPVVTAPVFKNDKLPEFDRVKAENNLKAIAPTFIDNNALNNADKQAAVMRSMAELFLQRHRMPSNYYYVCLPSVKQNEQFVEADGGEEDCCCCCKGKYNGELNQFGYY